MPKKSRQADPRLRHCDTVAAGRDDLDHDVAARAQSGLRHDRGTRSPVAHARGDSAGSSTSASATRSSARRSMVASPPSSYAAADRTPGPTMFARSGTAASRNDSASRARVAITSTSCAGDNGGVDVFRRDLGGDPDAGAVRRSSGGLASSSARSNRATCARGFTLTLLLLVAIVWLDLARAAALHCASHQQSDPAAHGGPDRLRRGAVGPSPRQRTRRRSGACGGCVQRHGRTVATQPRAARLPDPDVELAVAGAEDRARAEELADADSPDRRGDAGAAAAVRSRLHGPGRTDRRERDRDAGAARPRLLGVRQRAARESGSVRPQRRSSPNGCRC